MKEGVGKKRSFLAQFEKGAFPKSNMRIENGPNGKRPGKKRKGREGNGGLILRFENEPGLR